MVDTLRVGSGSAGHRIHRGAVPLPLEGKDLMLFPMGETCGGGRVHLIHR